MTNNAYIKQLDPIQGLIDYVEDIKPYHTKIIEVMIEYVYDDKTNAIVRDALDLSWGPSSFAFTYNDPDEIDVIGDLSNAVDIGDDVSLTISYVTTLHEVVGVSVNSGITTVTLTPALPSTDPGKLIVPYDVTNYFAFNISEFDAEQQAIIVTGPATADIFNGQQIQVTGSVSNNGIFTVTGSTTYNGITTTLPVVETIDAEAVTGTPQVLPVKYIIS